jgi:hypothetical protein
MNGAEAALTNFKMVASKVYTTEEFLKTIKK